MNIIVTQDKNNDIDPKITTLVDTKLKDLKHFQFLKQPLSYLVAPQEKDFLQELILDKSLILLNKKKSLHRITQRLHTLQKQVLPPLSIRFKAELTSPDSEASPKFSELRKEFDESIENCIKQCKILFIKTKELEVETATKDLQNTYTQHFHHIVDLVATHEIDIMVNTNHMEKSKLTAAIRFSLSSPGEL